LSNTTAWRASVSREPQLEGLVEFAVVALAQFGVVASSEEDVLGGGELVMG
jgi:hypothetical protein